VHERVRFGAQTGGVEMRTVFDAEHEDIRTTVRKLLQRDADPDDLVVDAATNGFLGIGVPEEYGGGGSPDPRFLVTVAEEFVRAGHLGHAVRVVAHAGVAAPLIAEHATAETRAQWLPGLATGVTRVGIGRTALRVTASGDELILYGHAHSVVDGPEAGLLVLRVSDPAADDAVVLVDTTSPGIARTDVATPLALGGANLADLIFDEVRVPAKSRLPHAAVADFDKDDRLWLAVLAVAGTRAALDTTIAYVKERKVFGTPVASFENTRIVLGEALAQCEAAETLIDAVIAERVSSTLTTERSAVAKLQAIELFSRISDQGMQLHGGYGYMREYPISQLYADARYFRLGIDGSTALATELADRIAT